MATETPLLPQQSPEFEAAQSSGIQRRTSFAKQVSEGGWSKATEEYFTQIDRLDGDHSREDGEQLLTVDDYLANGKNQQNRREFLLRHTLAYWVSVSFLAGSEMFIVGAFADIMQVGPKDYRAFVTAEYFAGAVAYFIGCYTGFLAVINLARKDAPPPGREYHRFRFFAIMRTRRSWWAQLSYTIGALAFGAGVFLSDVPEILVGAVYTFGSVLFVTGASLEVWVNDGFAHFRPHKLAFWISWADLIGSVLFVVGSLSLFWGNELLLDLGFLVGCFFFLCSSLLGMWMWKLEQYGNTYLPNINISKPSEARAVRGYQILFALVYATCITLAVSGIAINIRCAGGVYDRNNGLSALMLVPHQVLDMFIPLGLLALGSALHVIPEGPPFSYLLWWFRVAMAFQLGVQVLDLYTMKRICKMADDDDNN